MTDFAIAAIIALCSLEAFLVALLVIDLDRTPAPVRHDDEPPGIA